MSQKWIAIRRWNDFQHYGNRPPVWIKNYVKLLRDDAYLELSANARAVLHGLWILAAANGGYVPENTATLSRQLNLRVLRSTLESLNHAGFLELGASKPLAQKREEKLEPPQTPPTPPRAPQGPSEARWNDPSTTCSDCGERLGHGHLETCPRMPRTLRAVG